MPDTTQTTGTTGTTTPKTPVHHGLLDKRQLKEISYANIIYTVANDPDTFAKISDDTVITDKFMQKMLADLTLVGQYTGGATDATLETHIATAAEETAKLTLLNQVHYIQSKAKLKYGRKPDTLAEYGIGLNIDISRPALETAAANILNKLKTDTLPRITADHSTALDAALKGYRGTKVIQVDDKGDAKDLRTQLTETVAAIADSRRKLQHAADGEFPYNNPDNAGMRIKFDLPAHQPLNA